MQPRWKLAITKKLIAVKWLVCVSASARNMRLRAPFLSPVYLVGHGCPISVLLPGFNVVLCLNYFRPHFSFLVAGGLIRLMRQLVDGLLQYLHRQIPRGQRAGLLGRWLGGGVSSGGFDQRSFSIHDCCCARGPVSLSNNHDANAEQVPAPQPPPRLPPQWRWSAAVAR